MEVVMNKIPNNFILSHIDYNSVIQKKQKKNYIEFLKYMQIRNNSTLFALYTSKYDINKDYPKDILNWYREIKNDMKMSDKDVVEWFKEYHKKVNTKIDSYCLKYDYDLDYIYNKSKSDGIFVNQFVEEPGKQNLHEDTAATWLKDTLFFVDNFKQLPKSGPNIIYVIDGKVTNNKTNDNIKSIDFSWEYNFKSEKILFYATHKYTNERGGSQDNQYHDVLEFHKEASKCIDDNVFYFSITDGKYYSYKHPRTSKTKVEYMNCEYNKGHNIATTCEQILPIIINIIVDWLKKKYPNDIDAIQEIKEFNLILDKWNNL